MDPKSLASNTAALLALTIQVNGALHCTWDSGSSPTVDRLLYELARLRITLQNLEEAALQNGNPIVLGNLPRVFMALRRSLISLGSKLLGDEKATDIPSQNNLEMVWEAKMPGREPRILPLSKREGESHFNEFQVNIDSLRSLADIPDKSAKIISPELLSRSVFWSHRAGYTEIHARSQRDRVKGSGVWLLSHKKFSRWIHSDRINISNRENVLYCSGRPGSGKTILASTAIDEIKTLQRQSTVGLAYFYFSYRNKTSMQSVVLALLEQLYLQSSTVATEVQNLEARASNPLEQPLAEIISVLMSVLGRFQKVYIVLDALDECSSDHRSDLEALLSSFQSPHSRVLVTTRPSLDLSSLENSPSIEITPSLEDMRLFVTNKIQKIPRAHSPFSETQEVKITEALVRKGSQHGVFLLVGLQLNSIVKLFEQGVPPNFNLEDVLRKLTGDLAQVYDDQINRIMAQPRADCMLARYVISWLYYNSGSMPIGVLEDFLQRQTNGFESLSAPIDIQLVRKVRLDLVQYDLPPKHVSFFHFSFHEYIKERDRTGTTNTTMPMSAAFLARSCIEYFLQKELARPAGTPEKVQQRLRDFPFFAHAAHNWGRLLAKKSDFDLEAAPQKALLEDVERKNSVSEVLFLNEPRFFRTQQFDPFGTLHWITHSGLLRPPAHRTTLFAIEEINSRDFLERTPLHIAAMMGHQEAIDVIFDLAMKLGDKQAAHTALVALDIMQRSAWHHASMGNHLGVVQTLKEKLQRIITIQPMKIMSKDTRGMTPLCYAAERGHLEILMLFLDSEIRSKDIENSLRIAIQHGHVKVVQQLLVFGVLLQYTHLITAIEAGAENVVKLLLQYDVEIHDLALHKAIGKKSIMSSLIWNGVDLEKLDPDLRTPLSIAVENNDVEAVKILLDAGANPEIDVIHKTDDKPVPVKGIVWAASHGMTEISWLLRRAGANSSGALFPAIENGHYGIVFELLKTQGADKLDDSLKTKAVSLAAERGHYKIAQLLKHWDETRHDAKYYDLNSKETALARKLGPNSAEVHKPRVKRTLVPAPEYLSSGSDAPLIYSASQSADTIKTTEMIERPESASEPDTSTELDSTEVEVIVQQPAELTTDLSPPIPQSSASLLVQESASSKLPLPLVHVSSKDLLPSSGKTSQAVFILLESPVLHGRIPLGSLVRDPRNPLGTLGPVNPNALENAIGKEHMHEIHQRHFQMQVETSKKSALGISGFVGAQLSQSKESHVQIRSPHVWRQQIFQHDKVLSCILNQPDFGQECFDFIGWAKDKVYMVVGLFIMDESEVAIGDGSNKGGETPMPLVALSGLEFQIKASTKFATTYPSQMIHGIQYRSVRAKRASRFFKSESKRVPHVEIGGYFYGRDDISLL